MIASALSGSGLRGTVTYPLCTVNILCHWIAQWAPAPAHGSRFMGILRRHPQGVALQKYRATGAGRRVLCARRVPPIQDGASVVGSCSLGREDRKVMQQLLYCAGML